MLFSEEAGLAVHPRELWSDQLISQEGLWSKMRLAINQGRYPHLSLIIGKQGNGQLVLALSIAQTLLCTSENKPCGICNACHKVKEIIHPDLHCSFPLNNSKETCQQNYPQWRKAIHEKPFLNITDWLSYLGDDNKNANIAVAEINNFSSLLSLKPFESDKSVLILWLPEYLGKESNRLLKLFEEPPGNVYMILVSENSQLLLPTVLSRAQVFRMQAIQLAEASKTLSEKYKIPLNLAFGNLLSVDKNIQEAIDQLEQETNPSIDNLKNLLRACYTYNVMGMVEWTDAFDKGSREEQKKFLEWTQLILSFVLRGKFAGTADMHFLDNPIIQYADKLSNSLSLEQISQWVDLMDDCHLAIQRNARTKVLMLDFCIKLSHILKNTSINN